MSAGAEARRFLRRHRHGVLSTISKVAMIGIDVVTDGAPLRFEFDEPVINATTARAALVAMARRARV